MGKNGKKKRRGTNTKKERPSEDILNKAFEQYMFKCQCGGYTFMDLGEYGRKSGGGFMVILIILPKLPTPAGDQMGT